MRPLPLEGLLDTFGGLPIHPLIVHFAVVILPLAALAQLGLTLLPTLRRQWAMPVLIAMAGGTVAAFLAKESGEALATHVGTPQAHANWGGILVPVAVALTVVTAVWWFLQRKAGTSTSAALLSTQVLSAVLAVIATVLTVLAGHSGAEAAWGGRIPDSNASAAASASATGASSGPAVTGTGISVSPSAASTSATSYPMSSVARHNTASSCWTAIDGSVYDLTAWIGEHPGGTSVIEGLCGIDGTAAFSAQHGGDQRVLSRLSTFKLGSVSS